MTGHVGNLRVRDERGLIGATSGETDGDCSVRRASKNTLRIIAARELAAREH